MKGEMNIGMNIITIDWDYFFPDADAFDWGHSELNSIFYEMAWLTRPSGRAMFGPLVGQRAVDVFHTDPTRLKQVSLLMKNWNPSFVFIAESHKNAYNVIHDLDLRKINCNSLK